MKTTACALVIAVTISAQVIGQEVSITLGSVHIIHNSTDTGHHQFHWGSDVIKAPASPASVGSVSEATDGVIKGLTKVMEQRDSTLVKFYTELDRVPVIKKVKVPVPGPTVHHHHYYVPTYRPAPVVTCPFGPLPGPLPRHLVVSRWVSNTCFVSSLGNTWLWNPVGLCWYDP